MWEFISSQEIASALTATPTQLTTKHTTYTSQEAVAICQAKYPNATAATKVPMVCLWHAYGVPILVAWPRHVMHACRMHVSPLPPHCLPIASKALTRECMYMY